MARCVFYFAYCGGTHHDDSVLMGWSEHGASFTRDGRSVQSGQARGVNGADVGLVDVAGRFPKGWRRVVSDVAIEELERAGRSFPHVHCGWDRAAAGRAARSQGATLTLD